MENNIDRVEAEAGGKVLGTSWAVRIAGTWAPSAVLAALMFAMLLFADDQHPATRLALSLSQILLGVSLGVALTSKRFEDWKAIAEDRKREIDRMAEEKNDLSEIKKRKSSTPERRQR